MNEESVAVQKVKLNVMNYIKKTEKDCSASLDDWLKELIEFSYMVGVDSCISAIFHEVDDVRIVVANANALVKYSKEFFDKVVEDNKNEN